MKHNIHFVQMWHITLGNSNKQKGTIYQMSEISKKGLSGLKTYYDYYKHCSTITIAYRLNAVLDSDRIVLMDSGRIVICGCI